METLLCTKRNPVFATPAVGDRYLLTAGLGNDNWGTGLRFPAIDDTVQIQHFGRLSSGESVTIQELRNLEPNQE